MKNLILYLMLSLLLFSGCSKYKDPELAKKIAVLEAKENLDEFEKEELKDLKEQAEYEKPQLDSCSF